MQDIYTPSMPTLFDTRCISNESEALLHRFKARKKITQLFKRIQRTYNIYSLKLLKNKNKSSYVPHVKLTYHVTYLHKS